MSSSSSTVDPASSKKVMDSSQWIRRIYRPGQLLERRKLNERLIRATFGTTERFTSKEKTDLDIYRYVPMLRPQNFKLIPLERQISIGLRKRERKARRSTVPLDDGVPTGELQQYVMEQAQDIMYEMELQEVAKDWLDASALVAVGVLLEEHISSLAKPLKEDKLYRVSTTKKELQAGLHELDRQIEQEKLATLSEAKQSLNKE